MTTDKTPTDAELITFADAFDWDGWISPALAKRAFARAVLAKWGTPAGAGEVVDRSVAVNLARNAIERYDCKGITTKGIHTLCTALLAMDAQLSAGRPDGTRDQKTWCSYVAGMIATYLRKDADGAEATAIAGIIERRLMFLLPTTPQPTQAQAGAALAEADRRAGSAERELASCREDVARLTRVRDQMKEQWGVDRNVSFDVVWAEALKLKQQAGAVPLPKFLALKFHARRDKKATVTLLFQDHEAADAWVRGIRHKGADHG